MKTNLLNFCFCYTLIIICLTGCASQKNSKLTKNFWVLSKTSQNSSHFSGILVYDPSSADTIYSQNHKKYFTPASNTKIFTLYSALKLLPENIPALKYAFQNDTLYIEGTGDPSPMHPVFQDSTLLHFLEGYTNISFFPDNFADSKFGPGWAWEDYEWAFSRERSPLPLYGNVIWASRSDSLQIYPHYFQDSIVEQHNGSNRDKDKNRFYFGAERRDTLLVPIRTSTQITKALLDQALGTNITIAKQQFTGAKGVLKGMPLDSILKEMMVKSDNFLAEQILVMGSAMLSDTLNTGSVRTFILENHLAELKQPPRWVDGSGLSRYNLFTPESIVQVLHKLYLEVPKERLLSFFPAAGAPGTLEDWNPQEAEPYIYAKTGSLGNNYCLSGYLLTRSGKLLIFSHMNNHFRVPSTEIKQQMQRVLQDIHQNY